MKRQHVPSREKIAGHHRRPDDRCWACETEVVPIQKCHIIAHVMGGSDSDPANYVLLCRNCHKEAPDVGDPLEMWQWIESRETEQAWRDRIIDEALRDFPNVMTLARDNWDEYRARFEFYSCLVNEEFVPQFGVYKLKTRRWELRKIFEVIHNQVVHRDEQEAARR